MKLFPVAVEKMFVKFHFYLMVNNRKRFGNELLQQETEFNVCMKSERASDGPKAWHISPFSACLQMLSQMLL